MFAFGLVIHNYEEDMYIQTSNMHGHYYSLTNFEIRRDVTRSRLRISGELP